MSQRQRIDVVTTSRADYGLVTPVAYAIHRHAELEARMVFTGSHSARSEGFNLEARRAEIPFETAVVPCKGIGESVMDSGAALGEMVTGFSRLWADSTPGLAVLLGDRYELLAPASAAVLFGIPIAHLFGGEVDVAYCLDTQVRDALTKMAHIHFVTHPVMRRRLREMGEEDWRIVVSGNPAVDRLTPDAVVFDSFAKERGWDTTRLIAACYLPPTTCRDALETELTALLSALADWPNHLVVSAGVNTDPGAEEIESRLRRHAAEQPNHVFVSGLGTPCFHGLLRRAQALVGNSSSGLLEAASFGLPVVNVGVRQTGRLCGENVINVPGERTAVAEALHTALEDAAFRGRAARAVNLFYTGNAADRIANGIAEMLKHGRAELMLKRAVQGNPSTIDGVTRVPEYPAGPA